MGQMGQILTEVREVNGDILQKEAPSPRPSPPSGRGSEAPALAEKSVAELEIDDGEFRVMKQRLIAEKQTLQSDLSAIKERCLVRLSLADYQKLQRQRSRLVQQLMAKERELSELNAKRAELETVKQFRKESSITVSKVRELVGIRDHWHDFSMDENNAPMARRLAWKFSQQLREFLKPYFAEKDFYADCAD